MGWGGQERGEREKERRKGGQGREGRGGEEWEGKGRDLQPGIGPVIFWCTG